MHFILPTCAIISRELPVPDHAAIGIGGAIVDHRLHIHRLAQQDPSAAQIKSFMIGLIEQCLKPFFQTRHFIPERIGIASKVKILVQGNAHGVGRLDPPFKAHAIVHRQVRGNMEHTRRHKHLPPCSSRISSSKSGATIRDTIPDSAIISDIDPIHDLAMKNRGDIFDFDAFDADDPAIATRQIKSEMSIGRRLAPRHIDADTLTRSDNGRNGDHLAIVGQCGCGACLRHARDICTAGIARPPRDADRGQQTRQTFDARRDPKIHARTDRGAAHIAQFRGCLDLDQLKTSAEILICRNQRCIWCGGIGIRARHTILP